MPEQLPVPEPERYQAHAALQSRMLLVASDLPKNINVINPANKSVTPFTKEELGDFGKHDYSLFDHASTNERKKTAGVKREELDQKVTEWATACVNLVKGDVRGKKLFGDGYQNTTTEDIVKFYHTYFTGKDKQSNLKLFVKDTIGRYTSDGKIRTEDLLKDLPDIQWLANVFGNNSAEIVTQLIDAEVKLQTAPDVFITAGNQNLNNFIQGSKDDKLLTFLWDNRTATPQSPTLQPASSSLSSVPTLQRTPSSEPSPTLTPEELTDLKSERLELTGKREKIEGAIAQAKRSSPQGNKFKPTEEQKNELKRIEGRLAEIDPVLNPPKPEPAEGKEITGRQIYSKYVEAIQKYEGPKAALEALRKKYEKKQPDISKDPDYEEVTKSEEAARKVLDEPGAQVTLLEDRLVPQIFRTNSDAIQNNTGIYHGELSRQYILLRSTVIDYVVLSTQKKDLVVITDKLKNALTNFNDTMKNVDSNFSALTVEQFLLAHEKLLDEFSQSP